MTACTHEVSDNSDRHCVLCRKCPHRNITITCQPRRTCSYCRRLPTVKPMLSRSQTGESNAQDRRRQYEQHASQLTEVKARKVRPIRGAGSEELIEIPAHTRVRFRAGAKLSQVARE